MLIVLLFAIVFEQPQSLACTTDTTSIDPAVPIHGTIEHSTEIAETVDTLDIKAFCRENANEWGFITKPKNFLGNPWLYAIRPTLENAESAFLSGQTYSPISGSDEARSPFLMKNHCPEPLLIGSRDKLMKRTESVQGTLLCGTLVPHLTYQCAKGVNILKRNWGRYCPGKTSAPAIGPQLYDHFFNKVLPNQALEATLFEIAEEMSNTITQNKSPTNTDLYAKIRSKLQDKGFSKSEAEHLSLQCLAIYSTRGANLGPTLSFCSSKSCGNVAASLSRIAASIPYYDFKGLDSNGKMFSYPAPLHSSCDNGKPYHFWMAAAMACDLSQKLKSPKAAAAAVFTAAKGYQMLSKTGNRKPGRVFTVPSDDPFSQIIRMDLNYAAAGAVWGSTCGQNQKAVSLDDGLRALVAKSGRSKQMTLEEADQFLEKRTALAYVEWAKIFQPDFIFHYYEKAFDH